MTKRVLLPGNFPINKVDLKIQPAPQADFVVDQASTKAPHGDHVGENLFLAIVLGL